MKFRFCGDLDAPEWLLREVATLSRMTYVRIKLLVLHVINHTSGQLRELDMEKISKLVSTAGFAPADTRAAVAALRFIVRGAAQYSVDPEVLSNELNQLGLPLEHCRAFRRAYASNSGKLREALLSGVSTLPRVRECHWRADYVLSCCGVRGLNAASAQVQLALTDGTSLSFCLSADKLRALLHELREARSLLSSSKL